MSSLCSHERASLRARIFVVGRWRRRSDVIIHVIAQFRLKFVVGRWKRRSDDIVVHDGDRVRLELAWWFRAMGLQSVAAPPNSVAGVAARHLVSMNFDDLAS